MKKTKIVCTIGPSSWDSETMSQMIEAGMNCARVNGAFADEAEIDRVTKLVRDVSDEIPLMMDVKGPEVRMNKFESPIAIKPGDIITIGNDESSDIYPSNYKDLYKILTPGQRIVIGDGDVELKVEEISGDKMKCRVVFGELLKPGKAMNLPGASFATTALTDKDITNLKHAISKDWEYVSASFVQNAEAARTIKKHLEGSNMKLIAKIEDEEGVKNIDEILEEVDGIMIARGGLGVELGLERVPMVQRELIEKCNKNGKMVITATQMLESMTTNPKPTRAEVNDVATAILLGTDSVMLSGESSAGKYPVEAVKMLSKIAEATEPFLTPRKFEDPTVSDAWLSATSNAIADLDKNGSIDKVIVLTNDGKVAQYVSRHDLTAPVITITNNDDTKRHLALAKNSYPIVTSASLNNPDRIIKYCKENNLINDKDRVMIVGGLGTTNMFEFIDNS